MKNFKSLAMIAVMGIMFGSTIAYANAVTSPIEFYNGNNELTYTIHYDGSTYDTTPDETTFQYSLDVLTDPALSHWSLEFACTTGASALVDGQTSTVEIGTFNEPVAQMMITGIKFDAGQSVNSTSIYTITLPGEVGEADVWAYAKGGNENAGGNFVADFETITGPSCQEPDPINNTFSIDGTVFVDANKNTVLNTDEPTIENVTVSLFDTMGNLIAVTLTDSDGYYIFEGLIPGDYIVDVESSTPYNDFNETLYSEFDVTTTIPISVTITNVDSTGNDFGFAPDFTAICEVIDGDGLCVLAGDGKTIGFWKHQLSVADKGKGKAQIDSTIMFGYIGDINQLFLNEPFQLLGFSDALDVLKSTSSVKVDLLNKQLLGTEFNFLHEIGLDDIPLQSVLIEWGEYLSAHSAEFTNQELVDAKDIFDGINNSGQ